MNDGSGIFSGPMNRRMHQNTSFIHTKISAALINHTSIGINFQQTGCCHLAVQKPKGVNQEALLICRWANLEKITA